MRFIPRKVKQINDSSAPSTDDQSKDLRKFRDKFAWILLGEPGAGKSTALEEEANTTNGKFLRIAEFIDGYVDPDWFNKTLFLDGLDEIRTNNILIKISAQLRKLGNPPFRIACRAADWYGATDKSDLESASGDQKIVLLQLEPLDHNEILCILRDNFTMNDEESDAFLAKAIQHRIFNLLTNPQMLQLMVNAVNNGREWPATRKAVFEIACEKFVREDSKRHRDQTRTTPIDTNKILTAAGYLCTLLLLSNKIGFALDPSKASQYFINIDDCLFDDCVVAEKKTAIKALRRKLFKPEGLEECVVPYHRSIAEYLAAKWLAEQIAEKKIYPLRLSTLLFGSNDRAVTALRGLYGWLAVHCHSMREHLIKEDPLTVIIYGDASLMSINDKKLIFSGLLCEVEKSDFIWSQILPVNHCLEALAELDLYKEYLDILKTQKRDNNSLSHLDCVLEILLASNILDFQKELLNIIKDDSHSSYTRVKALKIWLKKLNPEIALTLLNDITDNRVTDRDDQLAGMLLKALYPQHIEPEKLLHYLHLRKDPNHYGAYSSFWARELAKIAPEDHLPVLMNEISNRFQATLTDNRHPLGFIDINGKLLLRTLNIPDNSINTDSIFLWLEIYLDRYGYNISQEIKAWLETNPERYKALFNRCCHSDEDYESNLHRLHNAAPKDIVNWHIEQASIASTDKMGKIHFLETIKILKQQNNLKTLSGKDILAIPNIAHLKQKPWFDDVINNHEQYQKEYIAHTDKYRKKQIEEKNKNIESIMPYFDAIPTGNAPAGIMYQLAGVWLEYFTEVYGDTIADRFINFYGHDQGGDILKLAEMGFEKCLLRTDLPKAIEIIELNVAQKQHLLLLPCLVGINLLWKKDPSIINTFSAEMLSRLVAFQLTYTSDNIPAWFSYIAENHSNIFADIFIKYVNAKLKAKSHFINGVHLLDNVDYKKISLLVVPGLLRNFPIVIKKNQLNYLSYFLKIAFCYQRDILPAIVEMKITKKSMGIAQKIYWHATNAFLNPQKNYYALLRYIGKTEARISHLSNFLLDWEDKNEIYELPANMLGKLIELMVPYAEDNCSVWKEKSVHHLQNVITQKLITRLGRLLTLEASAELDRLLSLPKIEKTKPLLKWVREEQKLRQRENDFSFLEPKQIAQILINKDPVNTADLASLALDVIDNVAKDLRFDNDNGILSFWNVDSYNKPVEPRVETSCRDLLLSRMWTLLENRGIDCQPEARYSRGTSADIRLSYRTNFEVPIEIKCDSNKELWTNLRKQLINQYSIAPKANGYGIYLVLWFDGKKIPSPTDGGKKPLSPKELKTRLEAQLHPSERQHIFIRVLDLSMS